MDVSIIIVNYNTRNLLEDCLASIYAKVRDLSYEIIVVDNDSSDGSQEMLRTRYQNVTLIASDSNLGFGKANNLGAASAKGEFLLLLNSDTILINNAVKILYDYMAAHSNIAICGGNLYTEDMKPATSFSQTMPGIAADIDYLCGGFFSKLKYGRNLNFNYLNEPLKIDGYISGADLMIRKSVFDSTKGFDPDFFMYYEETELTYRVKKMSHDVVSVPGAKIIHLEGASEQIKENSAIRSFKSKWIYFNKTGKRRLKYGSHLLFKLTAFQRYIVFSILGSKERAQYWKSLRKWESEVFKL